MSNRPDKATPTAFAEARHGVSRGLLGEFYFFLTRSKKLWLIPIVIVLLMMGLLIILGGTAAAPFIYTLF